MNPLAFMVLLLVFMSSAQAQDLRKIDTDSLKEILAKESSQLTIINFWATWCSPCVTELPYFQSLASEYSDSEIEILLISLDFPSQVESTLLPFIQEKKINLEVLLMTELDYNKWISKVDESWKGNLPATLFFHHASGSREFRPGALEKDELHQITDNLLTKIQNYENEN